MKGSVIGSTCSIHREMRNAFQSENLKVRYHLGDLSVYVVLKSYMV
jgi:hypothetical protein